MEIKATPDGDGPDFLALAGDFHPLDRSQATLRSFDALECLPDCGHSQGV
jgi:hypothetical protein